MNKAKTYNSREKNFFNRYSYLEFIISKTAPSQRYKWLKEAWSFWHQIQTRSLKNRNSSLLVLNGPKSRTK